MISRFLVAAVLWCLVSSVQAQTLLIMGDSLSAAYGIPTESGWVNLLEQRLKTQQPAWKVVNASISGETTSGGLTRFKPVLEREKPALVVLELGANDGLRGLPLEDMKRNLKTMIEQAHGIGAKVILLGMKLPPNYGLKFTSRFEKVFSELAAEKNVTYLPFFLDGVAGRPEFIQSDGLHPLASAQPIILENVWPVLEQALKEASASSQYSIK